MMIRLLSILGVCHAECIVGDLDEERALREREATTIAAARWYAWQMSRLLARSLATQLISVAIVVAPPLFILQWLWTALFDYLCLIQPPGLLQVNVACLLAGALLVLPSHRLPVAATISAGLALALLLGPTTYPLLIAGTLAIPAGLFTSHLRKATA